MTKKIKNINPKRRKFILTMLLVLTAILSAAALMLPMSTADNALAFEVGDVVTQDILAPKSLSYTSTVLTEIERQQAEALVPPVYTELDITVASTQVSQLTQDLDFIEENRNDEDITIAEKIALFTGIENMNLSIVQATDLIELTDNDWINLREECLTVLTDIMSNVIQEDAVLETLNTIQAQVDFNLHEDHIALTSAIVTEYVRPNRLYSEELTNAQRQAVRNGVPPVVQSFLANEILISRGNVITEADLETLGEFGLLEQITTWENYASVGIMVLINFVFIGLYMQYRQDLLEDLRGVFIMVVFFVIYLFAARFTLPNHVVLPYLFPIASFGLLTSALVNPPFGRIVSIPLAILVAYGTSNSLELVLYFLFTSLFGVLVLKNANRIILFFWAGLAISVVGAAIIVAFRIGDSTTDYLGILTLIGAAIINGLGSVSITVILQYFIAQSLGLTTTLQLIEVSRPDHKLLQFILHNAPGTYQHSLLIANLAEQAAEKIKASALLTRVGALYHDAGKALNPHFFIENKLPDSDNPHESLSPLESSKIIIQHVVDGETLAKKYHLPKRVRNFITEHHGTLITRYQYHLAVERAKGDAGLVDESAFRYPGPAPQSVETMLVMLADACEARARAERPDDEAGLRKIIREIIDKRREEGQLDDVPVTMQELSIITESFTATLKGIYHPRIKYPTEAETEALVDNSKVAEEEKEQK